MDELARITNKHSLTRWKVALVTGAASGIGRAAAFSLARFGYRTIFVEPDANRGVEELEHVAQVGASPEGPRLLPL